MNFFNGIISLQIKHFVIVYSPSFFLGTRKKMLGTILEIKGFHYSLSLCGKEIKW